MNMTNSEREDGSQNRPLKVGKQNAAGDESAADALEQDALAAEEAAFVYGNPTYTISRLTAANKSVLSVRPDASVMQAVTIMLCNDFSQLPVMTTPREVKGVVTWQSIGVKVARGRRADCVRDVMEPHHQLPWNASIFEAIPIVAHKNYVLIRGPDAQISGIVTASDMSLEFQELSEPFLLLGEIENHLRGVIGARLTLEELAAIRDSGDTARTIEKVADLTFGDYVRLLQSEDRWRRVGLALDRETFCKQLDGVRTVRNDVMHFDRDAVPAHDLRILRDFVGLLRTLRG